LSFALDRYFDLCECFAVRLSYGTSMIFPDYPGTISEPFKTLLEAATARLLNLFYQNTYKDFFQIITENEHGEVLTASPVFRDFSRDIGYTIHSYQAQSVQTVEIFISCVLESGVVVRRAFIVPFTRARKSLVKLTLKAADLTRMLVTVRTRKRR
jgi:hypothetical protein